MSRIVIIVQARMSSKRLPGKILKPLAGAPSLARLMERLERVSRADERVVATSEDGSDDPVAALCEQRGIACVRGSLDDVLARYHKAAVQSKADVVVRVTGDCPLIDPTIVDACIGLFLENESHVEYASNVDERTFPDGFDVEVASFGALDEAMRRARGGWEREHVTPYVRRHFRKISLVQAVDLADLRLTLDHPDDYAVIAGLYEALYPHNPRFDSRDIYQLLLARRELIRTTSTLDVVPRIQEILR